MAIKIQCNVRVNKSKQERQKRVNANITIQKYSRRHITQRRIAAMSRGSAGKAQEKSVLHVTQMTMEGTATHGGNVAVNFLTGAAPKRSFHVQEMWLPRLHAPARAALLLPPLRRRATLSALHSASTGVEDVNNSGKVDHGNLGPEDDGMALDPPAENMMASPRVLRQLPNAPPMLMAQRPLMSQYVSSAQYFCQRPDGWQRVSNVDASLIGSSVDITNAAELAATRPFSQALAAELRRVNLEATEPCYELIPTTDSRPIPPALPPLTSRLHLRMHTPLPAEMDLEGHLYFGSPLPPSGAPPNYRQRSARSWRIHQPYGCMILRAA